MRDHPSVGSPESNVSTSAARTLGRLERVALRKAWPREADDFTRWLADEENLKLLGEAIGLELELVTRESQVGPFRADILCRDTLSDTETFVLVENQIERTDHRHLGQLLTYAAGLKAVTIVWVAAKFCDEHRAALDWLNEITDEEINFFGLEIELWQIGDSPAAPKFNIVSKPNDWIRSVHRGVASGDASETKKLKLEFWTAFAEYAHSQGTHLKLRDPRPRSWTWASLGRSDVRLAAVASLYDSEAESFGGHEVRAEVVTMGRGAKENFSILAGQRPSIEAELGEALIWRSQEGTQRCRIYVRRPATLNTRDSWPEYHAWLLGKLEALHRVFAPRASILPSGSP